jgi:hypothetical protein
MLVCLEGVAAFLEDYLALLVRVINECGVGLDLYHESRFREEMGVWVGV